MARHRPATDVVSVGRELTGSTGSPKAVRISHRNVVSNAEAMFIGANFDMESDVIVSWLRASTTWA